MKPKPSWRDFWLDVSGIDTTHWLLAALVVAYAVWGVAR